ncbi:acyl-CoA dehydrogenase family protein [Nocardia fusca]|uniref:acyl-CoA dehydrogenase family protein n=1 Tax=Nocardia fusca TaxID=941183 RepID=UPI0037B85FDC
MYYSLSAEQRALSESVRDLLGSRADPRSAYPAPGSAEAAPESKLWSQFVDMGIAALLVPEERGGSDAGPVELILVAEEIGRAIAAVPFLGTSAASAALSSDGVEGAEDLLERIATGTPAAIVVDDADVQARETADEWQLDGAGGLVVDAAPGGDLLVGATTRDGRALFHTTAAEVVPQVMVDRCRRVSTVRFQGTPARLVSSGAAAEAAISRARAVGCLVLAADSAGVAAAVLDLTAEYAKTRHQFGLPIGTFQGVKHRLADSLVLAENARSATWGGAWALAEKWSSLPEMIAMAKATATANGIAVAAAGVQLHGGIAITWEHDMHLYLRRAKANELLLGEPSEHLETIAAALLDNRGGTAGG